MADEVIKPVEPTVPTNADGTAKNSSQIMQDLLAAKPDEDKKKEEEKKLKRTLKI
jgi:hypothetical protein